MEHSKHERNKYVVVTLHFVSNVVFLYNCLLAFLLTWVSFCFSVSRIWRWHIQSSCCLWGHFQ